MNLLKFGFRIIPLFAVPLIACGGSARRAEFVEVCQTWKDLVLWCYDASDTTVACEQLVSEFSRQIQELAVSKSVELEETKVDAIESACGSACDARKNGRPWSAISEAFDCNEMSERY